MGLFSKNKGEEAVISVDGMSCQHCVGKVEKGLGELEGVFSVKVDLEQKETRIQHDPAKVSLDVLKQKISDLGYRIA